jgi:DNA-binding transcriptional LysR family regulator
VAVAEERHFTRAAARLHVAQPSVSAQIRTLERSLGAELFYRDRKGVMLTASGEELLPLARQVTAGIEEAALRIQDLHGLTRGRVSIGATPSLATTVLPEVLGRFHKRHPGIALAVLEEGSHLLVERLAAGDLDLALVILPLRHSALETSALATEELVLAVGKRHRLAARARSNRRIAFRELAEEPLVMFREGYDLRSATVAAARSAGFVPKVAIEGGEMASVLAFVASGLGAAIVPSIVALRDPRLTIVRLANPALHRTIGLARRSDRTSSRAATALGTLIDELLSTGGWPGPRPVGLEILKNR